MGKPQSTGNLVNALAQDSSNNIGIGGAANASFKLQVTGATNLTGVLTLGSTISNGTYTYTLPSATGTIALTSNLSSYLPLTGGTLTGALSGTSAEFNAGSSTLLRVRSSTQILDITAGASNITFDNIAGDPMLFKIGSSTALTIASTGAATFSSSVTATIGTFSSAGGGIYLNEAGASAGAGFIQFQSQGVQKWNLATGTNNDLLLYNNGGTNSYNIVVKHATGNVGIGTSSPTGTYGKLSVAGGISILDDNNGKLEIGRYSSGASNSYIKLGPNSNSLRITNKNDTADIFTIENGGNVGIGTSSPSSLSGGINLITRGVASANNGYIQALSFDAASSVALYSGVNSGDNPAIVFQKNLRFGSCDDVGVSSFVERARITSGGNVLIGTTSDDARLTLQPSGSGYGQVINHTNAGSQFFISFRYNGSQIGSITGNNSNISVNGTSDYRLKEDLKEINGLEKVLAIKVYDFKWKNSENRMDGVIAHELQEVLPYAVNGEKDGEQMQGVDYSKLVPILVKSIQELEARIKQLENK